MCNQRHLFLSTVTLLALVQAAGCGSDGSDAGGNGGNGGTGGTDMTPAQTVEDVLAKLQIDTTPTPRLDDDGDPLPDDYAPLGPSNKLERFAELALLGFEVDEFQTPDSQLFIAKQVPDGDNNFETEVLTSVPTSETPWIDSRIENPDHLRAAAAGDFDGDGFEELAIVYFEENDSFVRLIIIDDESDGFARSTPLAVSDLLPVDLAIEGGDFDGDGDTDAAIGIATAAGGEVVFLEARGGGLALTGESLALTPVLSGALHHFALAAGNLDYDLGEELAIVFNERLSSEGRSQHVILDDVARGRMELSSGPVRAEIEANIFTAMVADVTFGNLDEDPLEEVVFGGLTNISGSGTSVKSWGYLLYALDDGKRDLALLSATQFEPLFQGINESGEDFRLNYLHVNALDLDGDRIDEVQANQFVYDDFVNSPPWTEIHAIPNGDMVWDSGAESFGYEDSTVVVGDVNSDRREDIIFVSNTKTDVRIWALDMIDGFSEIDRIETDRVERPIVVPVNVDDDSIALDYSDASYQFVFTEPVIIAAMAAAPCNPSWGQNDDACRTSYGTAESASVTTEQSQTVTASVSAGFSTSFSFLGVEIGSAEVVATVSGEATRLQGTAYTLTQTVEHTTGPVEDGVLFTTIPLDQYIYTIVSHPNPELIGGEIVVSLPREPITVLTDREFYNSALIPGGFRVDERVFEHVPGDPLSYPSRSDRNRLLGQFEGIESLEVDVGQGGGDVTVGVSVFEETSEGTSYSWNASLDIQTTAGGVLTGASVGYGEGRTITIGAGSETSYTGTVANLDAENFAANGYSFGLFSYIFSDPEGPQFEVLNYWVNPTDIPSPPGE